MTETGLEDMGFSGYSHMTRAIAELYDDLLKRKVVLGEPISVKDVSTACRTYDHGDASERTVFELGVRAVFDAESVQLSRLTDEDGENIRSQLRQIADSHFPGEVSVDVIPGNHKTTGEEAYWVWLIDGSRSSMLQD